MVDPRFTLGPATGPFAIIGASGQLRSVNVRVSDAQLASQLVASASGTMPRQLSKHDMCLSVAPDGRWLRVAASSVNAFGRLFTAIAYTSTTNTQVRLTTVKSDGSYQSDIWPTTLTSGQHVQVLPVDGRSFDFLQLTGSAGHARVCVNWLAVLQPVESKGHSCTLIDEYGATGPRTTCGNVVSRANELSEILG